MPEPFSATALLLDRSRRNAFLGSCFAFRNATTFLTAAHCIKGLAADQVGVSIHLENQPDNDGLDVIELVPHPTADLAILRVRPWSSDLFPPYRGITEGYRPGDHFAAFGYPEDATGRANVAPIPRFFRGHFQRFLEYRSPLGYSYVAGELSIRAPSGLSGGPVFLPDQPDYAAGVVAENIESSTHRHTVEEVTTESSSYREVVRSIVDYGICVMLDEVRDWLDTAVPPAGPAASENAKARLGNS